METKFKVDNILLRWKQNLEYITSFSDENKILSRKNPSQMETKS